MNIGRNFNAMVTNDHENKRKGKKLTKMEFTIYFQCSLEDLDSQFMNYDRHIMLLNILRIHFHFQ